MNISSLHMYIIFSLCLSISPNVLSNAMRDDILNALQLKGSKAI